MVDETSTSHPRGQELGVSEGDTLDEINRKSSPSSIDEDEQSFLRQVLFYLPNRVMDLWDVFRLDVGIGSSGGVVGRFTRHGQIGYRYVNPVSFRFGTYGRHLPFFIERYSEGGVGSDFDQTPNRHVTPYEVGLGVDAFIVGAYAGLSFDEFVDFLAGWVLIDPKADDF